MDTLTETPVVISDENVDALVAIVEGIDEMTPERGYFDWLLYDDSFLRDSYNYMSQSEGLAIHVQHSDIENPFNPASITLTVISKINDNCTYSDAEFFAANRRLRAKFA